MRKLLWLLEHYILVGLVGQCRCKLTIALKQLSCDWFAKTECFCRYNRKLVIHKWDVNDRSWNDQQFQLEI